MPLTSVGVAASLSVVGGRMWLGHWMRGHGGMAPHECGLSELELGLGVRVFGRGRPIAGASGSGPGVLRRCWPDPVRESLALDEASEQAVERIVELEAVKARLEAQLLDTYGWLHTVLGQQYDGIVSRTGHGGRKVPIGLDQVVAKEICAGTGLGEGEVTRRLALAIRRARPGKLGWT